MTPFSPETGDWAVITGAATGIGRFLAEHFAVRGMNIAALDIDEAGARSTADLVSNLGRETRAIACDVSDRASCVSAAEALAGGGIVPSLLWLNAGVGSADQIAKARPETLEWVMGVNVFGPVWCAQVFLPAMRGAGGNRHVGITASSASVTPVAGPFTLYATTKQMTAAVAEALTAELADEDIGVTILCPGILNTEIWNSARNRPDSAGGSRSAPEEAGAHWRAQPPPEVLGDPIDAALAKGGGWCIVATEADTEAKMLSRHNAQEAGFDQHATGVSSE